jgi:hypothetical protein
MCQPAISWRCTDESEGHRSTSDGGPSMASHSRSLRRHAPGIFRSSGKAHQTSAAARSAARRSIRHRAAGRESAASGRDQKLRRARKQRQGARCFVDPVARLSSSRTSAATRELADGLQASDARFLREEGTDCRRGRVLSCLLAGVDETSSAASRSPRPSSGHRESPASATTRKSAQGLGWRAPSRGSWRAREGRSVAHR